MDRNSNGVLLASGSSVALRKESVDRNFFPFATLINIILVALRKESVDRNISSDISEANLSMSLSARRAWIEINK